MQCDIGFDYKCVLVPAFKHVFSDPYKNSIIKQKINDRYNNLHGVCVSYMLVKK